MVVVRSRGPSHCTSRSGSTCARNTRSRGASNSLVMVISGMPGSAVITVSVMVASFRVSRLAAAVVAARLQRREQVVEALVALVPEPLIASQPGGDLAQRLGLKMAEPRGRAAGPGDEPGVL